ESWKRHGPARHQTLRATMDWSYELLSPAAQQLLRRLSVFVDGFTLAAATSVGSDGDEASALDLLGSLADASLINVDETAGVSRYSFLETVRQYAAIRLVETDETDETGLRFARFALAIAEAANLSGEAEGLQDHRAVVAEEANICAALDWASAHDVPLAVRLAIALENFWVTHDPPQGARWLALLLADSEALLPADLRARALRAYGSSLQVIGERKRALHAYEQSLQLFRALADERSIALLLHRVAMVALEQDDADRAEALLTESLELARRAGSRRAETQALGSLGSVERARGDTDRARQLFEQSEAMAADLGRTWWRGVMLTNLAELAFESSDYAAAESHASSSLRLAGAMGDRRMSAHALLYLARIASASRDDRRAGRLVGAIEIEEQREAISQWPRSALTGSSSFSLDRTEFNRGRTEGRQLSLAQASDYALGSRAVPDD
ncbi:MAG TPA: tetratricopeptide repeat protein, partial [Gaiellaceae bacterium]|nr:tetratricopeptide repeat protein [Gaiellaceae bacterium]